MQLLWWNLMRALLSASCKRNIMAIQVFLENGLLSILSTSILPLSFVLFDLTMEISLFPNEHRMEFHAAQCSAGFFRLTSIDCPALSSTTSTISLRANIDWRLALLLRLSYQWYLVWDRLLSILGWILFKQRIIWGLLVDLCRPFGTLKPQQIKIKIIKPDWTRAVPRVFLLSPGFALSIATESTVNNVDLARPSLFSPTSVPSLVFFSGVPAISLFASGPSVVRPLTFVASPSDPTVSFFAVRLSIARFWITVTPFCATHVVIISTEPGLASASWL